MVTSLRAVGPWELARAMSQSFRLANGSTHLLALCCAYHLGRVVRLWVLIRDLLSSKPCSVRCWNLIG